MSDYFQLKIEDRVATITFNCPEKRNPLNESSLSELETLLRQVEDDSTVRVMVLTGVGNTFCAGADLSESKHIADPEERRRVFGPIGRRRGRLIGRVATMLSNLEPLTIAAVNGYAIGGGWSLALACDFRIAVDEARFWYPEVDLGVPLSPGSTALVMMQANPSLAKDIIIGCKHYTAEELLTLGFLNKVVSREQLAAAVEELANSLAAKNPGGTIVSKMTINAFARGQAPLQTDLVVSRA
jgi:enoyl-CoA hydratase/carnithine racemase